MLVDVDPRLAEEAVFLEVRRRGNAGEVAVPTAYRLEVEPVYEIEDEERREDAFREVHAAFFVKLGFERVLVAALGEFPRLRQGIDRVTISRAAGRRDEGAELFVKRGRGGGGTVGRTAVVRLRAELFLDRDLLITMLRRELAHLSDMVDPAFAYEPDIGPAAGRPELDLIRDRYHVLGRASIESRLERDGRLSPGQQTVSPQSVARVFPNLDPTEIDRIWRGVRGVTYRTHRDLLALARGEASPPGPPSPASARAPAINRSPD